MLKTVRKTIANNSVLKRLTRSDDGMVLIWVAVLLPVIFGFTALAVDAAYLFAAKSRAQAAADAGALAGVYIVESAVTADDVRDRGKAAARANIPSDSGLKIGVVNVERGNWAGCTYPTECFTAVADDEAATAVRAYVALADDEGAENAEQATGVNLFFARAIGFGEQDVTAYAVANVLGGGTPEACLIALNESEPQSFYVNGNNEINANKCSVKVCSDDPNAAAEVDGGAADVVIIDGEFTVDGAYSGKTGVITPEPIEGQGCGLDIDPYDEINPINEMLNCAPGEDRPALTPNTDLGEQADLSDMLCSEYSIYGDGTYDLTSMADLAGAFSSSNCDFGEDTDSDGEYTDDVVHSITGGDTIYPGVYCGGLTDYGSGTTTMEPGVYFMVDGPMDLNAVTLDGSAPEGVTIVMIDTGGASDSYISSTGSGAFDIRAPTTGPFAGFVIYEAPTNPVSTTNGDWKIAGNTTGGSAVENTIQGAIYTPNAWWSFRGDINTNTTVADSCFLVISDRFEFRGGTDMTVSAEGCGGEYGGTPLITDDVFALVE